MRTAIISFLVYIFCVHSAAWAAGPVEELRFMKEQLNAMQENMKNYEQRIRELETEVLQFLPHRGEFGS